MEPRPSGQTHHTSENQIDQEAFNGAVAFAKKNIIPGTNGRECVDGRYDQHGAESGLIARAGADFGYVMGLLALKNRGTISLSPEECVDAVYDAVTKDGDKFYAHSDHHAIEEGRLTGCGHIMKASLPENSELFGVNPDDITTALLYLRDKTSHQEVDEPVLQGEHDEKGVLVVQSESYTLDHHDDREMYFVYDATRDVRFIHKLVKEMNIPGVDAKNFKDALDDQTDATLKLLAAGKPILEVAFNDEVPQLTFKKFVANG